MNKISILEKELLKTGYDFYHFGAVSKEEDAVLVDMGFYFETGVVTFDADGDSGNESVLSGKLVYFTKDNSGAPCKKIENILRANPDIMLSNPKIAFDIQSLTISYEWSWTII